MVLVGEKRAVKAGWVVVGLLPAFSPDSRRRAIIGADGQREVRSEAGTHRLDSSVVDATKFSGTALILAVLLLFLFPLQEIFFQREGFDALAVGQQICAKVGGIIFIP